MGDRRPGCGAVPPLTAIVTPAEIAGPATSQVYRTAASRVSADDLNREAADRESSDVGATQKYPARRPGWRVERAGRPRRCGRRDSTPHIQRRRRRAANIERRYRAARHQRLLYSESEMIVWSVSTAGFCTMPVVSTNVT